VTEVPTVSVKSRPHARRREGGQIIVLFVLGLLAIVAVVGLVIDAGSAYAMRRDEQNVADLAAIAGATAYLNTTGDAATKQTAAQGAATALAGTNGYMAGVNGVAVDVQASGDSNVGTVTVGIAGQHRNTFVGVLGMSNWTVSVEARAISAQRANAVKGALPLLFNAEAFPAAICDESSGGCVPEVYQLPGSGNEDVPQDATQFNWTIFCTANGNPCNANSNGVRDLIEGGGKNTTIKLNDMIGPLNAGSHTTLFQALDDNAIGQVFPVPIVCTVNNNKPGDANPCPADGTMVGFAYFRLVSVEGGSEKVIRGYFVSPIQGDELEYIAGGGDPTLHTGSYQLELTD
jgi:hypothetical protein